MYLPIWNTLCALHWRAASNTRVWPCLSPSKPTYSRRHNLAVTQFSTFYVIREIQYSNSITNIYNEIIIIKSLNLCKVDLSAFQMCLFVWKTLKLLNCVDAKLCRREYIRANGIDLHRFHPHQNHGKSRSNYIYYGDTDDVQSLCSSSEGVGDGGGRPYRIHSQNH